MSQISPLVFFRQKRSFLVEYIKKTPRRTELLIFPVWNKICKIWDVLSEIIKIEVQCSKNYAKIFYLKKLELLEITKKRNRKSRERQRQTEKEGERGPGISNFTIRVVSNSYLNLEIFTSMLVLVLHKLCLRHDFPWLAKNILISCKDYDIMQ